MANVQGQVQSPVNMQANQMQSGVGQSSESKPIFKKLWFWIAIVVLVLIGAGLWYWLG